MYSVICMNGCMHTYTCVFTIKKKASDGSKKDTFLSSVDFIDSFLLTVESKGVKLWPAGQIWLAVSLYLAHWCYIAHLWLTLQIPECTAGISLCQSGQDVHSLFIVVTSFLNLFLFCGKTLLLKFNLQGCKYKKRLFVLTFLIIFEFDFIY